MSGVLYGSGVIYNDGTVRGRIHAQLAAAQDSRVRQTGLRVHVIDSNINRWVEFAGADPLLITRALQPATDRTTPLDQAFFSYRLGMSMCILSNGTIIRARVGNGTFADRQIWVQTITDPTIVAQWNSWSVLYTGAHFAVAVVPATASTYHCYTARVDGIHKNNVLVRPITGIIAISPVIGQVDAMFVTQLVVDAQDRQRAMELKYSPNIETTAFTDDRLNYRWSRTQIAAIRLPDGRVARIQVANFYADPRSSTLSESITVSFSPSTTVIEPSGPPTIIRGFLGQAGLNSFINPLVVQLSDGMYYLFYGETRLDASRDVATNVPTLFWQRSSDLMFWTEPVAIGFSNMAATGIAVVERGDFIYLANNNRVYRRSRLTPLLDLSNFVSTVEMNLPSGLEHGDATLTVANPGGMNNSLLDMADREVVIQAGLRVDGGIYRFVTFGRWWISEVKHELNGRVNRIQLTLHDIWKRLENPLRDIYNFIGRTTWADWLPGGRNQLFNYYFRNCTAVTVHVPASNYHFIEVRNNISTSFLLYTGWRGHNAEISARHRGRLASGERWGLVYRYVDDRNYMWAQVFASSVVLSRVRSGTATVLASATISAATVATTFRLRVIYRWGIHRIHINDILVLSHDEATPGDKPGYAGIRCTGISTYRFDHFRLTDWQTPVTTDTLLQTALVMGDFHNLSIAAGQEQQLALAWGPQTDLPSPAAAIRQLAEQYKLDFAWRGNRISIGKFRESIDIALTLANQVIETETTEQVGRRINLAIVDGREDSFTHIDGPDTRERGRQIVAYFDVPALTTHSAVRERAQEEVRRGVTGKTFSATIPLLFNLWKMDAITIVDHNGVSRNLRVEGLTVSLNQSQSTKQTMTLELSALQ